MNVEESEQLRQRLASVRERLAAAVQASGRNPQEVRLIAVSKLHPAEAVAIACQCGQLAFGENYIQEALAKQDELRHLPQLEWHCIGHVQTNKAKDIVGRFCLVHTVDSLKFAQTLARRMQEQDPALRQAILIQVNIGDEPQKSGVATQELPALAEALMEIPALSLQGLMCLPPLFGDGEKARPYFALLRTLRDALCERVGLPLPVLSMGMSDDFVQAVEEGATLVRIGTDIFGSRPVRMA